MDGCVYTYTHIHTYIIENNHIPPYLNLPVLVDLVLGKRHNDFAPRLEAAPCVPQHLPRLDEELHGVGDHHLSVL